MTAMTTEPARRPPFLKSRALRRFVRHRLALVGLVMVVLLSTACFLGPHLLAYDELSIDLRARFAPPFSGAHIFGTDPLGRDIAARLFHAGQISMAVGFSVMIIATCFGSVIGVVSGYYGGRTSAVLMRVVDAFLSFPSVFLLLALAAFIQPGPVMIALIIASTSWMEVARIVEAEVKSLRNQDFVQAAHMLGLTGRWIMFRELLPNAIGPIIVAATLTVARAILLEAYISFLGYGIQPPLPSWGNMLNGAQQYLQSAPWLAIVPGLAITIAVTGFNFIGDGLRDAFDSRTQEH
ncbi:ABC transporter permease [Pseudooceanicola sp. CBS1P-1]|uniref:ABC transporter permease subunit n=1 Tax=Pseudooceanicola albus TaxID=2692189 RepID=A0A6L7GB07_9RHOB|nr:MULTISPECIES: ABC transporter permease [Pseudooceanicola]MBT9384299.1 ABC transporter permease [Pseudooceanicola endophyticus]MXN19963.1 ABC transporter permease subunit [Pseudooceanicola albus]